MKVESGLMTTVILFSFISVTWREKAAWQMFGLLYKISEHSSETELVMIIIPVLFDRVQNVSAVLKLYCFSLLVRKMQVYIFVLKKLLCGKSTVQFY